MADEQGLPVSETNEIAFTQTELDALTKTLTPIRLQMERMLQQKAALIIQGILAARGIDSEGWEVLPDLNGARKRQEPAQ